MTDPGNNRLATKNPDPILERDVRFWNRSAAKYSRSKIGDQEAYQRKLTLTQALFTPEMKVLEFGCGTGSTAIIHAPFVKHYHATDVSSAMLEIAKNKVDATDIENLQFEKATLDDIAQSGDKFDAVLGMSILHLVDDMKSAVQQAYNVLEPGGAFVSSTVCMSNSFWFMRPFVPLGRFFGWLPLVRFFSRKTLESTITQAGFTIEESWQPKKLAAVFIIARK